jgi:uncharacterized membrane protein YedE/YeeE
VSPFYAIERLVFWLIVIFGMLVLFNFSRKRFQQVILVGILSVVGGVVIRLFSLQSSDETDLRNEAYFLIGIGALYGVIWLASRYLGKSSSTQPPAKR